MEYIAAIYDGEDAREQKLLENISVLQRNPSTFKDKYEKALNKELVGHVSTVSRLEFNKEIQKKIVKIKDLALDYAHDMFNCFLNREKPLDFMENRLTLFKIFLLNTENNKILARVCKTLETIKSDYPAIIKSQHQFENQLALSKFFSFYFEVFIYFILYFFILVYFFFNFTQLLIIFY